MACEDDYDWCDEACPKCGHGPSHSRDCGSCGGDGCIDAYEDDPVNCSPGDLEDCAECRGSGYQHWCPNCGYDFVRKCGGSSAPEGRNSDTGTQQRSVTE